MRLATPLASRRSLVALAAVAAWWRAPSAPAAPAAPAAANVIDFTFTERSLGLVLQASPSGRAQVTKVQPDSAALEKGVPPLAYIDAVNGKSVTGLPLADVRALIGSADRPLTLRIDTAEFAALSPAEQSAATARALGMESDKIRIELLSGPQDPSCAFKTRTSDFIQIEFTASLEDTGRVIDSSQMRSGRPFAFQIGAGGVTQVFLRRTRSATLHARTEGCRGAGARARLPRDVHRRATSHPCAASTRLRHGGIARLFGPRERAARV